MPHSIIHPYRISFPQHMTTCSSVLSSPSPSHTDLLSAPQPLPLYSMPTQIPPQRDFHPSENRPGLVTHHGDDGLTAHLRERPGPSGKQAQRCIKYEGEKENMFYLLARTKGKGDRNAVYAVCIKT